MSKISISGLYGTNPLGFLAALGLLVAFDDSSKEIKLSWSDDVVPHAIIEGNISFDDIVNQVIGTIKLWRGSKLLHPAHSNGESFDKGLELKLNSNDVRDYLSQAKGNDPLSAFVQALIAEGVVDNKRKSKPTDLYFTAGQQKFLLVVKNIFDRILSDEGKDDIINGLIGPWKYEHVKQKNMSLMWDVHDDRNYALRAFDPSGESKGINPGVEALAILGMSMYPVFAKRGRTLTQGCSGKWKEGNFSWPLWESYASFLAVKSLLAHAYIRNSNSSDQKRVELFKPWSVKYVFEAQIRRSSQGGYGTFGPPVCVWKQNSIE